MKIGLIASLFANLGLLYLWYFRPLLLGHNAKLVHREFKSRMEFVKRHLVTATSGENQNWHIREALDWFRENKSE